MRFKLKTTTLILLQCIAFLLMVRFFGEAREYVFYALMGLLGLVAFAMLRYPAKLEKYVLGLAVVLGAVSLAAVLALEQHFLWGVAGVALFLTALFKQQDMREKLDWLLWVAVAAAFIGTFAVFPETDQITLILRAAAIVALVLLSLVLLIGPWSRFSSAVRKLYHFRRHMGVVVFLLALLHSFIILPVYFDDSFPAALSSPFIFYGSSAGLIMLALALTSSDKVQLKVDEFKWKILHGLLLLAYLGSTYFAYNQVNLSEADLIFHSITVGVIVLFWIFIAPYSVIQKVMKTYVSGWKQTHVLAWVAYVSVIVHVARGPLNGQPLWAAGIFWGVFAFVVGSHTAGWIVRWLEDSKIKGRIKKIDKTVEHEGKRFVGVISEEDFGSKGAMKVYVKDQPVGLFKVEGKFMAISNLCRHQKGPLHQGRVVGCAVECPWHSYTFSLEDGSYLGKQDLKVPVYETLVRDGVVFVSEDAKA